MLFYDFCKVIRNYVLSCGRECRQIIYFTQLFVAFSARCAKPKVFIYC